MSLINKTEVSLEEKLASAENTLKSARQTLNRVEKKVEELKNEGRIDDAIFAAKIAAIEGINLEYRRARVMELRETIAAGSNDMACSLSYTTTKYIRQGFAKLVVENCQLYNEVVGTEIEEGLVDYYYKEFAEG